MLAGYFLLLSCRKIQLNCIEINEADTANKMLCLCDLLFINLRGMNLVKCILPKGVLLWKILDRKRGTRWIKVLQETHLLIRDGFGEGPELPGQIFNEGQPLWLCGNQWR